MKIKTVIQINHSTEKVFRYLTNSRNMPEWMMGLQKIKSVKGRRPAKGSISTQVFKDAKGLMEVKEEVVEFERNKTFALQLSHKNMETTQLFSLAANEDGTKLTVETQTRLIPAFIGIFGVFMKDQMRRQQEQDLKKLKRKINEKYS